LLICITNQTKQIYLAPCVASELEAGWVGSVGSGLVKKFEPTCISGNAVHCGFQGRCRELKVVPACL